MSRQAQVLSKGEIEKRVPVWNALSDLFLDTELDETTHQYIAKVVVESGYSAQQVHDILWREVFPAVGDNLRVVAGEWAGFNPDWLKDRILSIKARNARPLAGGLISVETLVKMTKHEWSLVCSYMPSEMSEPLLARCEEAYAPLRGNPKKWWRFW
ncbi:hypothetical protein Q8W30_14670 [Neptunomonas phycophila]|uniref:DUF7079 domain-containing protein n=1 Tax=Neptunomonas phycophila TaxID=1572645 RepID=A0AAW7XIK5_9GAMM|nr:hypothetical protein [Neptunomonas phycophila]MDO6453970.1 hypothetical protein [Neptunomonas phycophila]MDP2523816.1 hypothetical protein [Neptunomonas phycophila]